MLNIQNLLEFRRESSFETQWIISLLQTVVRDDMHDLGMISNTTKYKRLDKECQVHIYKSEGMYTHRKEHHKIFYYIEKIIM